MKTLYISDLDGTLLRSDERTSDYTNNTINRLSEQGMLFSYATARSYHTAHKVTEGLNVNIPLIIYNGAMIADNADGHLLAGNFFGDDVRELLRDLFEHEIFPIVYAFADGIERFSYIPSRTSSGMKKFLESRKGDIRDNPVKTIPELVSGEIFYLTCIDTREKLEPMYEKYKEKYHCVFQVDIYTNEQWLEIMPKRASKANAAMQLKELLECDRLVVFGDGKNDIDMFEAADEAYAAANAEDELKAVADGVIGDNNSDGVAVWLNEH